MSKNKSADLLQELVVIARDGAEFYDAAGREVGDANLKEIFGRMGTAKRDLIAALTGRLEMIGEHVPERGTMAGSIRKRYADVRAMLSSDTAAVYVAQLEETEDRLLHHFEDALASCENAEVSSQLQAHLPLVRSCHDEMRQLKLRRAA